MIDGARAAFFLITLACPLLLRASAQESRAARDSVPVAQVGRIEWDAPPFAVPDELSDSIRFGYLHVPQFHDSAGGRTLRIAFAIVKARAAEPPSDPIVVLPGGPGSPIVYSAVAHARSARIAPLRGRDLILIDPRAHGYSDPRMCDGLDAAERATVLGDSVEERALLRALGDCRDRLTSEGFRLEALHSDAVARDVELLRRALGAPRLNLMGISHGSRLVAAYLRRFPEAVRSAAVHGPLPPSVMYVADAELPIDEPLRVLFERCRAQPECREEYPDLERRRTRLMEAVRREPPELRVPQSEYASSGVVRLTPELLEGALSLMLRNRETARGVPLLVHHLAEGRYWVLAPLGPALTADIDGVSAGAYLGFVCNEIMPFVGDTIGRMRRRCERWVSGRADSAILTPPRGSAPVLVAVGEFDPATPAPFARIYASTLERAQVMVVAGYGHDVWFAECVRQATAAHFESPGQPADTTCAGEPPIRFITGVVPIRWSSRAAAFAAVDPARAAVPWLGALLLLLIPVATRVAVTLKRHGSAEPVAAPAPVTRMIVLASATGILFLIAYALAVMSALRASPIAVAVGVPEGWGWIVVLPWLIIALCAAVVYLTIRGWRRAGTRVLTGTVAAGMLGIALVLAMWGAASLR